MTEVSISKFAAGMQTSPIGQRTILPKGDNYLFEKTNNNYNIIVEFESEKWTSAKETDKGFVYASGSQINKPVKVTDRWVMLNNGFEKTTKKTTDVSVTLDFKTVPVKSVLRMKVTNDKGYSSLDLKPLTPKELKALTSETIN